MPVEWDQFEAVDAPKSDVPWSDYEAVEPPVKRNKLGESKEDLAWQMQNARAEGKLGKFGTDAITGLQNTAEVGADPLGSFSRLVSPVLNKLAGQRIASDYNEVPMQGVLDTPLMMAEDALQLPRGYFKDESNPVKGITDSIENTATGLTNRKALPVIPLFGPEAGVVAPVASTVGKVLLGGEMAHGTTEAARNFGNVIADPDSTMADKANALTGAATAFAMTGATAGHALPKVSDVPIPDFSGRDLAIPEGFRVPEPPPAPKAPRAAVPETAPEAQRNVSVIQEIKAEELFTRKDVQDHFRKTGARVPSNEEASDLLAQAWSRPAPEEPAEPTQPFVPPDQTPGQALAAEIKQRTEFQQQNDAQRARTQAEQQDESRNSEAERRIMIRHLADAQRGLDDALQNGSRKQIEQAQQRVMDIHQALYAAKQPAKVAILPKPPLPNLPRNTFAPEVPETPAEPQKGMTALEEIRNAGAKTKEDIRKLYPQLNREQAAQLRNQAWGEPAAPIVPPEAPAAAAPIEPEPVTPPPATNEQLATEAKQGKFAVTPEAESLIQEILGQPSRDSQEVEATKAPEPAISDRITQKIPAKPSNPEVNLVGAAKGKLTDADILSEHGDFFQSNPVGAKVNFQWPEGGNATGEVTGHSRQGALQLKVSGKSDPVFVRESQLLPEAPSAPLERAMEIEKTFGLDPADAHFFNVALDEVAKDPKKWTTLAEGVQKEALRAAVKGGGSLSKTGDIKLSKQIAAKYLSEAPEDLQSQLNAEMGDSNVAEPTAPETPAAPVAPEPVPEVVQATAKAKTKISEVAATEGERSAKDIKSELVSRIEDAIENPSDSKQVVIDIPDDGKFTIANTPEALGKVLVNAKRIATNAGKPERMPSDGSAKAARTKALRPLEVPEDPTPADAQSARTELNYFEDTVRELKLADNKELPSKINGQKNSLLDAVKTALSGSTNGRVPTIADARAFLNKRLRQIETLAGEPSAIDKAEQWANDKLKGGGTSSGPDVLAAYAVKGAITIARGIKDFGEWSADMIRQLGEAVRPHLQDIWERVKGEDTSPKTADEILAAKPGSTTVEAMAALSDEDAAKVFNAKKEGGAQVMTPQKDSVLAGMKLTEKDVPRLEALRDEAGKKMMAALKAKDQTALTANFGKNIWYSGAIEGAKRKGANYDFAMKQLAEQKAAEPAGLAKNVRNVSGATGEGGFVKIPSLREITDKILGGDSKEKLDAFSRWRDNHTTPKTMAASEASGNAINRYAAAAHAAPLVAKSMAMDVLGANAKNVKFRQKLGAVLVEDRLRAIKDGFVKAAQAAKTQAEKGNLLAQANEVNTLVGSGKAFATETDFKAALKDPEIRASIAKHKATIQANATKFHTETGGNLAGPGVNTGAFVNLEALHEDKPEMVFSKGGTKGDYSQPFKKKSVFNRQAAGTGKNYELDYNQLAERMIRGNFQEYAKRQMYDQLQKDGLAKILPPNAPNPNIDGKPSIKFQIVRRGNQTENLWVRKNIASEVRQALNLDGPLSDTAIAKVASLVNKLQMSLATDAVYHMANIMSAIAGKQGGKNIWTDIARKVPGVNIIDAGIRIGAKARQVLADDPEIVKAMAEISQIGASRPEHAEAGRAGRMIALLDKSARLIRNDMYDNLVQRGIITASEGGRREFINQVGQYNPRLMGTLDRIFKEAGISPFIVAGKTFNRAAVRTTTLDPGYKAATRTAAVQGRVIEGLGVVATLVAIPALMNSLTTGKPNGRKGVQFGQIDTGKNDSKGNPIVVDPAQWIGLRRGLRMTGVNALINGMRAHKPGREIAKDAGTDIIGAITHPWAGPVVQAPTIFATGHNTSGYAESSDPNNYVENFKSALKSINPVVHAFFSKNEDTLTGRAANAGKSFGGAVGIKTAQAQSSQQEVQNRARSWGLSSDIPKVKTAFEQREKEKFPPSIYKPLKEAVGLEDSPKIIQSVKDLLAVEPDQKARDKRKKEILREFNPFTKSPDSYDVKIKPFATRDKVFESAFIKSLDASGKESYRQSVRDQVKAYRTLTQALYNKASDPKDTPEAYRTK